MTDTHTATTTSRSADGTSMWVNRITEVWQSHVPLIFEVGNLLVRAKQDPQLPHGAWMRMAKTKLPFGYSVANRLMKIAECEHFRNLAHGPTLPACWRTLYELTKLTPAQFAAGIASGEINPGIQRKAITELRGAQARMAARPGLREQLAEANREIERLRRSGGDLFGANDSPRDIAAVLVNTINNPSKIRRVITEINRLLREQEQ
jgi:hypothetical protein